MPTQDTTEVKEKVVSYIRQKGPALPVHVAREIGISSLFISAYLSELISAKKLKVSKMKVGNSPLYYIPGQESQLENFSTHLKPQEKEALEYLKEKEILKDSELEPATRVALQSVEDFAIPFENSGEKYWRYMTVSEEDALGRISETEKTGHSYEENAEKEAEETSENKVSSEESDSIETSVTENPPENEEQNQVEKEPSSPSEDQEPKFESPLKNDEEESKEKSNKEGPQNKVQEEKSAEETKTKKKAVKKSASKKSSSDKTNKFFNKVKEHLSEQDIEINDILGIGKDELILKINENGGEKLLVAFNKNKLDENDFIKAYKKASSYEMKFTVLSKQGALKKIENLLEAFGKMDSVKSMK